MAPLASTTCHLRWSKFFFGKYVFIKNPSQGAENLPNRPPKSTGKKAKFLTEKQPQRKPMAPHERPLPARSPGFSRWDYRIAGRVESSQSHCILLRFAA
jgi:hypothetical protein